MRAHYCWRHVSSVSTWLSTLQAESTPFALPGTSPVYPQDHPVVPKHLHLEITVDPEPERVEGHCTVVFTARADAVEWVQFDASELTIESVYIQGHSEPAEYRYDGRYLKVKLWEPLQCGDDATVVIGYHVEKPRLGLYFIKPTLAEPQRPVHVWSQNQDDDARYWFPCIDSPGLKMSTSIACTVPHNFMVLANGIANPEEAQAHENEGWHTWRWQHDLPHPVYLVTLVIGEFVEHTEDADGTPIVWYSLPGRQEDADRAFAKTAEMIRFFSEFTGVPYPYARYGQVAVSEFVFGGMENTTLTTVTERCLPDERASLDYSADSLVAHELAHQWFGDLVTCREWAHAWLNEGFATYFDCLFKQYDLGQDEFDYELLELAAEYFDEDNSRYRRPIVCRDYEEPIDLFDRHLYHKGAWVLHMLRSQLGDVAFKRGVNVYLQRFGVNQAETSDLRRAFEDATGRSLTAFFDQWIFKGGYPALTVKLEQSFDDAALTLKISHNSDESWDLRTEVWVMTAESEQRVPLRLTSPNQTIVLPSQEAAVEAVVFDPDATLLCTQTLELPAHMLICAMKNAPSVSRKIDAARALGKKLDAHSIDALIETLNSGVFWGVRKEVAKVLAGIGSPRALDSLIAALASEQHPKARRGIVQALGEFIENERAHEALSGLVKHGDDSYFVEAEASRSLGKVGCSGAEECLKLALDKDSFNDVIRSAALHGLSLLRTEEALQEVESRIGEANPTLVRVAAITALGRFGRDVPEMRPHILRRLKALVPETHFRIQIAVISSLSTVSHRDVLPLLDMIADRGNDGRVTRRAREVTRAIRAGMDKSAALGSLQSTVDRLKQSHGRIAERIGKLEG